MPREGARGVKEGAYLVPRKTLNVEEQTEELGDGKRRMRVVQLDRHLMQPTNNNRNNSSETGERYARSSIGCASRCRFVSAAESNS